MGSVYQTANNNYNYLHTPERKPVKVFPKTSFGIHKWGGASHEHPSLQFYSPQHHSTIPGFGTAATRAGPLGGTTHSNSNGANHLNLALGGSFLSTYYSPQRDHYSDRFIPCRTDSVSKKLFSLKGSSMHDEGISGFGSHKIENQLINNFQNNSNNSNTNNQATSTNNNSVTLERDDNQKHYNNMLEKELLEIDTNIMNFQDKLGPDNHYNNNGEYKKQTNMLRF